MLLTHFRRRLVATVAVLLAMAAPAWAIIVVDGKTGLFGVTGDQTIRVSVLNAGARGGILPCVRLFDLSGRLLAEMDGAMIRNGEGTFVDFDAAQFRLAPGQRLQVRVEVALEQPPDPALPPDPTQPPDPARPDDVILTLEVYDTATGRTEFTMPWVLKGFNRQSEPPAAAGAR